MLPALTLQLIQKAVCWQGYWKRILDSYVTDL
jgi:hypothetical protein